MRILIAEDDITSRTMLAVALKKMGRDPVEVTNGLEAWQELQKPDAPKLVILDWVMPGLNGLDLLRRVRALPTNQPPYILMLTSRAAKEEIVAGLEAGADDYLVKPYNLNELRARLAVGQRMLEIQQDLAVKIAEVRQAKELFENLVAVARATLKSPALAQTLQDALDVSLAISGADSGYLFLLDGSGAIQTTTVAGLRPWADQLPQLTAQAFHSGLEAWVVNQQQPALITATGADERWQLYGELLPGVGSALSVPIVQETAVSGTITLLHSQPHHFTPDTLTLMTAAVDQMTLSLKNARLFQDVQEERGRLQAIIQSNRDGLIMIGSHQRLMAINQPALRLLNLSGSPADWQGRDLRQLVNDLQHNFPEIGAAIKSLLQMTAAQPSLPVTELQLGPYTVRWEKLPVMAGPARLGHLLLLQDVTEERAVAQLRTDLIRTMVHDLRNPLTVISGVLELIMETAEANQDRYNLKLLENANQSSHQMLNLVSTILDINRLESDRMPLAMQPFDLSQVAVAQCVVQMPLARRKGIQLITNLPESLPPAWGDQEVVGRILQNLIGNALKFTPENGRVQVRAALIGPEDRPLLKVSVQDTGPGIPPELEGRLFEQFVTGQHPAAGSGLGLAYCQMAVNAHGQQISGGNTAEGGAIFTFTLAAAPDTGEINEAPPI
jgi:two-component system, NtrC family, sensor histidine kinase KinB